MPNTIQDINRELANRINAEARSNPQSPYANKFVGIANGKVVVIAVLFFFSAIIGFCYSHVFALSACCALVEGFSAILMISCFNIAIQHLSSDEMRGRVMSIYATSFLGLPPLGALLAGELSRHIPTGHVLAAMAATAAVLYISFYVFSKPLRELD